ncbi:Acetamidase/formamidase [Faunimonas pinastri]|uniref:Acetamidase/formamidase n=1 Tax=Faunimonas pinastri TaxID=1855383 RepID=A0A1H9E630_9HYPH|nr:acetamidase/formamidase family protein [Faunimonas pinastri]SEQ21184.1 Acetamidase/formamidase [Faunimonas pinastri]
MNAAIPREATHVAATAESVTWGFFDAVTKPTVTVSSGSEVVIDTISGDEPNLPDDPKFELLPEHREILKGLTQGPGPHLLTGPVAVEGLKAGGVLQVEILDVQLRQNWGYNVIVPLLGTLPDDFPNFVLHHLPIDRDAGIVTLPWGGRLATAPFFGVMGVAPPPNWRRITTTIPRAHGGNMDNKELVPGTTVYLPAFCDGGLFSVGDGHAVQGDGEVCITAVETALSGRFRLTARDDMSLAMPRAETPTHYITMGFDEDLDDAVKQALRDMIRWIGEIRGLSAADAYTLCSLAADLRVTQTVNVAKGIHCMLPKGVLVQS